MVLGRSHEAKIVAFTEPKFRAALTAGGKRGIEQVSQKSKGRPRFVTGCKPHRPYHRR